MIKKFLLPFQNMVRADLFSGSLAVWNALGFAIHFVRPSIPSRALRGEGFCGARPPRGRAEQSSQTKKYQSAVYFKNSSNGILPSPRGARLGCGGAKMSGSAAHTDNFKFFFGGIQIRACEARTIVLSKKQGVSLAARPRITRR